MDVCKSPLLSSQYCLPNTEDSDTIEDWQRNVHSLISNPGSAGQQRRTVTC